MRKTKEITIKGDEAAAHQSLCDWAGRDGALRFALAVLNTRPAIAGTEPQLWHVPSSSGHGHYLVDIDVRACTCDGFHHRHRCPHLAIADRAARLRFELLTATPAMPVGQTERHQAQAIR
jgi:hypothetical protein